MCISTATPSLLSTSSHLSARMGRNASLAERSPSAESDLDSEAGDAGPASCLGPRQQVSNTGEGSNSHSSSLVTLGQDSPQCLDGRRRRRHIHHLQTLHDPLICPLVRRRLLVVAI